MNTEHKSNTPANIKDLWRTPPELFNRMDQEFGFDCDVAASDENHLCANWLTEEQDALCNLGDWGDVNWCNPPYSDIGPWVDAAIEQAEWKKTTVMLVPADTSVKWFKRAFETCTECRFISGRISFINAETGKPVAGNNKGSVLFIWRAFGVGRVVSLVDRAEFGL